MGSPKPTRSQGDLAEMLETLLDKGVVINADIAVTVGDTELLGVRLRAAIASFETAAEYGLEFPAGTDMERVAAAADVEPVAAEGGDADRDARDLAIRTPGDEQTVAADRAPDDGPAGSHEGDSAAGARDTDSRAADGVEGRDKADTTARPSSATAGGTAGVSDDSHSGHAATDATDADGEPEPDTDGDAETATGATGDADDEEGTTGQ
jgi:hypothetical protein